MKSNIISAHGMLPILEVLETCKKREVILKLLTIVNTITDEDVEVQENICFVGGIPIITKFASKKYQYSIRLQAAAFVRQMYSTSTLTLQMFVSCGGLGVLVEFLEEDYEAQRDLVVTGIYGICLVFELQVCVFQLLWVAVQLTVIRVQRLKTTSVGSLHAARFYSHYQWHLYML